MQKYREGITVFTPTYNRADKLERLYKSLLIQDNEHFEWLIVDDGSTDATKERVQKFIDEEKINIRYIYKENGGKHTALNVGMHKAEYEYFVCIDSDDYMAEGAINAIMECAYKVKPLGIIAYKTEYNSGKIIGDQFPDNVKYSTLFSLMNNYGCNGDKTIIHRTELLEEIYIPEPIGVKFFPETYMFDKFDEKYESFLLRKSICICEYLEEGYSLNYRALLINNAVSFKWSHAERIDFPCKFKQRFIAAYRYDAYAMLAKSKEGKYKGKHKLMPIIAFPAGLAMYIVYSRYRKKYM